MTDDELIAATRAKMKADDVASPASADELADAEAKLGFALAPLLRRILQQVGNGGESIGHGLLGVPAAHGAHVDDDGRTMLEWRAMWFGDGPCPSVFAHAVPIADLGCAQWVWLDCDGTEDGVVLLAADPGVYRTDLTLRTYWENWLAGEEHTALFEPAPSAFGINPFTKQRIELRRYRPRGVMVWAWPVE